MIGKWLHWQELHSGWWFFATPLKKYESVNWDDEIPNINGKTKLMATKPPTSIAFMVSIAFINTWQFYRGISHFHFDGPGYKHPSLGQVGHHVFLEILKGHPSLWHGVLRRCSHCSHFKGKKHDDNHDHLRDVDVAFHFLGPPLTCAAAVSFSTAVPQRTSWR